MPRDYRTGRITIQEAKQKFNDYYDNKHETPLSAFKAKLFDMMYTKKDKFLIKCNNTAVRDVKNDINPGECEKGSVKYLLDEGPKTFDAEHVDAFKEDDDLALKRRDGTTKTFKSKGATKKNPSYDALVAPKDLGGPRVGGQTLYSEHFKKQYNERAKKGRSPGGGKGLKAPRTRANPGGVGNNLVDGYWDEYYKQKESGNIESKYERKNKLKHKTVPEVEVLLDFTIGAGDYYAANEAVDEFEDQGVEFATDTRYKLIKKDGKIFIQRGDRLLGEDENKDDIEYYSQIDYLQKVGFLSPGKTPTFNTELSSIKLFNIKLKKTRRSKKIILEVIFNISTGELTYDPDELSDTTFKTWYTDWVATEGVNPKILDFWRKYEPTEDMESVEILPITITQMGGDIHFYNGEGYSSSSDEYSIYSSDEE